MNRAQTLFSCGLELADLVVASDLVHRSWEAICDLSDEDNSSCGSDLNKPTKKIKTTPSPRFYVTYEKIDHQPNYTVIAFACSSSPKHPQNGSYQPGGDVAGVLSPTLQEQNENHPFDFLRTKGNSFISINEEAITLFVSLFNSLSLLSQQLDPSTPLIITGQSQGGSVASLFTLWLLENSIPSTRNLPLCITFGSPLIGDTGLRQAILDRSTWHSRFLHLVSHLDLIPRLFISSNSAITINNTEAASTTIPYKPFGTFLMCSESGCACFEDPDSVLELMEAMGGNPGSSEGSLVVKNVDYGVILEHLKDGLFVSKGALQLCGSSSSSLRAGLDLQLEAVGVERNQEQLQENNEDDHLVAAMEEREKTNQLNHKKRVSEADKKLNEMKINMAQLEWYKKTSLKDDIGYYDCYKDKLNQCDMHVTKYKIVLTRYWEEMVKEAERKPQKQGMPFQTRWLYGGTNYRRMVEPLDIAEYYKKGGKNYRTEGRSNHYIMLEKWQKEEEEEEEEKKKKRAAGHLNNRNARNKAASLTEDSCLWADVEEAIILTNSLENGEESSWEELKKFESNVMGLINSYKVSREIFLQESSFRKWWKKYEMVVESLMQDDTNNSELTVYMKNKRYLQYA